jgi:hypothetical protein
MDAWLATISGIVPPACVWHDLSANILHSMSSYPLENSRRSYNVQERYSLQHSRNSMMLTSNRSLSLIGYDAITHMTEEMPRPTRDAPLAMLMCVAIGGVTYVSMFVQKSHKPNTDSSQRPFDDHHPPVLHSQPRSHPHYSHWQSAHRIDHPSHGKPHRRRGHELCSLNLFHQRYDRQCHVGQPLVVGDGQRWRSAMVEAVRL